MKTQSDLEPLQSKNCVTSNRRSLSAAKHDRGPFDIYFRESLTSDLSSPIQATLVMGHMVALCERLDDPGRWKVSDR